MIVINVAANVNEYHFEEDITEERSEVLPCFIILSVHIY